MVFHVTAQQMVILFLFMALGYFLMKRRVMPENSASVLSKLQVSAFLPAMVFKTFATQLHADQALAKLPMMLTAAAMLLTCWGIAIFLARMSTKDPLERDIYIYSMTVPNLGYMGYPIVEAVLGPEMLLDFMIIVFPFNVYIYSVGMYILNPNREWSLKKLFNAPMVAMVVGIVFGMLNWPVPDVLIGAMDAASACMAPCAMLLTGFVLAKQPVRDMLASAKGYVFSLLRLVVFPLVGWLVMKILGVPDRTLILCVIALAMPFGLNSVIFTEAMGGDSTPAARLCLLGNIFALGTIPLAFYLLSQLYGI